MPINSLDELKATVKDLPQAGDLVDFVVRQIESEKNTGIDKHRKANKEAEGLRKSLQTLKDQITDLGFDFEAEGADVEEFFENLKKSTASAPESNKELKKLTRQLNEMRTQLEAKTAAETELRERSKKLRIKSQLARDLSDKVYAHDFVVDGLINQKQVDIDEDGDTVVWLNGDQRIPYEAGLKSFIEKNSQLVKNTQKPGAGTPGAPGSPASSGKMTFEQMEALTPQEAIAKMSDIKASLGLKV